jgi:hypothetical protein
MLRESRVNGWKPTQPVEIAATCILAAGSPAMSGAREVPVHLSIKHRFEHLHASHTSDATAHSRPSGNKQQRWRQTRLPSRRQDRKVHGPQREAAGTRSLWLLWISSVEPSCVALTGLSRIRRG